MSEKADTILKLAQVEAETVETWADLSIFLFDPDNGIISKAYPRGSKRSAFMKSPEYKAIRRLLDDVENRTGFIEGATPKRPIAAFDRELARRIEQIRNGTAVGIPAEKVFAKLRKKYS